MNVLFGVIMALSLTGEQALDQLKKGNETFVKNPNISPKERVSLAKKQTPIATVLACSDSRVPPEFIFDKNLGDLFVVRIAGNTVDQLSIASLEYGVSYLKTPLLVILGHQNCGAVTAAFDLGKENYNSNIGALLAQIHPAIHEAKKEFKDAPKNKQIEEAIRLNLEHTKREILWRSQIIRNLETSKKLSIEKGVYMIDSGKVNWY